jgi:hypothetical protein
MNNRTKFLSAISNRALFSCIRHRRIASIGLSIIAFASFPISEAIADSESEAEVSTSIYVYIPAEGASSLLVKGTRVEVIMTQDDDAVVSLALKNGLFVQTQIPLKYLHILSKNQNVLIAKTFSGPNPVTASPVQAPPPDTNIAAKEVATFYIENIHVHDQVENLSEGIMADAPSSTSQPETKIFIPQVEAQIRIARDARTKNLIARAYYYDSSGQLICTYSQPSIATRKVSAVIGSSTQDSMWPTILPKDVRTSIYFPLPAKLPASWSLVVVFGNSEGAVASSVPCNQEENFHYPERDLVAKTVFSPNVDIDNTDPNPSLIEEVVKSDNSNYPAFTLLMHLPHGITNPKDVSGVLTVCMLAKSVQEIRDKLNAIKPLNDSNPYFAFAEAHNMAVIAWGSRWVWKSYANFDELDKNQMRGWDDDFQTLADAWDRGIDQLVSKYGIPDHDYLMYGLCAGGEWVHRLALHKPDRFLAVQMHISTSYDEPTADANHVMWLLTTGELDCGCDRARRFYSAAKALNYPIVFKAFIGMGHADSPAADQLGIRFFDYALALKNKREAANANNLLKSQTLDLSGFNASPFYGDLMNQDTFAAQDKEMIPRGFLVPLPTKDIADAWNK